MKHKEKLQTYLDKILEWPGNFVHCYGSGLLMVKFKVCGQKYEIVFDEHLEVQNEVSDYGEHLDESAEFYKTESGCSLSMRAPSDWIFIDIFKSSRNRHANGSSPAGAGSGQCGEGS